MGKSTTGPSMEDCYLYVADLEDQWKCDTTLLMSVGGMLGGLRWHVTVLSCSKELNELEPAWSVSTSWTWPSFHHQTFEGALLAGIVYHDAEVGRAEFNRLLTA